MESSIGRELGRFVSKAVLIPLLCLNDLEVSPHLVGFAINSRGEAAFAALRGNRHFHSELMIFACDTVLVGVEKGESQFSLLLVFCLQDPRGFTDFIVRLSEFSFHERHVSVVETSSPSPAEFSTAKESEAIRPHSAHMPDRLPPTHHLPP
jgi:hypothetical protein